jgi:hypothetical protein
MSYDHSLLCTISNICMLRKNTAQQWLRVKDLFGLTLHVSYTSPYTIWSWWQSITFRVKWLWNTMNSDANSYLVDGTWHVEYLLSHIFVFIVCSLEKPEVWTHDNWCACLLWMDWVVRLTFVDELKLPCSFLRFMYIIMWIALAPISCIYLPLWFLSLRTSPNIDLDLVILF